MEHVCFGVAKPGVRERFPRLIDVLLTLSTCRCVIPSVPDVVVRQLRILTFASPSVFAISASVPGRFSWEILNCLTFGMAGTPREGVRGVDVPRILLSSEQRVKLREWLVVGYFDLCCVASRARVISPARGWRLSPVFFDDASKSPSWSRASTQRIHAGDEGILR